MILLTHYAGLRVGEVACVRWQDVVNLDGSIKDEIRLLPDMTKGRHARTVFVSKKLREEIQAFVAQAKCVDRSYHLFSSQKSVQSGFSANSLTLTWIYQSAGIEGASSHSGRRIFLTNLANKGSTIHLLKTLAGHRNISLTAAYLYSSPDQLKAVVKLAKRLSQEPHDLSKSDHFFLFTATLKTATAENLGTVAAAILMPAPVSGYFPLRAARLEALQVPNPINWTSFLATVLTMVQRTAMKAGSDTL